MAIFLANYSSWGQVINFSSIVDGSTIDYTIGSNPQLKNDGSSSILLAYPAYTGISAVSIPIGGMASVGYPGLYTADKGFFI